MKKRVGIFTCSRMKTDRCSTLLKVEKTIYDGRIFFTLIVILIILISDYSNIKFDLKNGINTLENLYFHINHVFWEYSKMQGGLQWPPKSLIRKLLTKMDLAPSKTYISTLSTRFQPHYRSYMVGLYADAGWGWGKGTPKCRKPLNFL